jgi:hypothetical protein
VSWSFALGGCLQMTGLDVLYRSLADQAATGGNLNAEDIRTKSVTGTFSALLCPGTAQR